MLMAADGIPEFIPDVIANIDKKNLVTALAIMSIASYLFYHIAERVIEVIISTGRDRIERQNQKLHLFEGQEELTKSSYKRYIDGIASLAFIIIGIAFLTLIYPEIALTFISYTAICISLFSISTRNKKKDTTFIVNYMQKNVLAISGVGFFLIFICVIIDYIFFSIPNNFIFLLLAFIFAKQMLTREVILINSLIYLHRNKEKLISVLFKNESFNITKQKGTNILSVLDTSAPIRLEIQESIRTISINTRREIKLNWHDSGITGVGFFTDYNEETKERLLIKVFEKNKTSEAIHEASFLLDNPMKIPCPKLIKKTIASGLHIHIFDITNYEFPTESTNQRMRDELEISILNTSVSKELQTKYLRSHKMLWDQIDESRLMKLEEVSRDGSTIRTFMKNLPYIRAQLKRLPLVVKNHTTGNFNLYTKSPHGEFQILHWGKWSLEPLGATYYTNGNHEIAPKEIASTRNIIDAPDEDLMIAFFIYQLNQEIQRQLLNRACQTIDIILETEKLKINMKH